MKSLMFKIKSLPLMMACISMTSFSAYAEEALKSSIAEQQTNNVQQLNTITLQASADASSEGLMPEFAGGQVATGGRIGIFGNQKNIETPFSLTSYTHQYIQEKQLQSVGDVLKGDPSVTVGRGYGNFQESYFIRGFSLGSDDTAYNGLYSILPRQYIPTELFERVEVFKGASAFLNGAAPSNGGIGGTINLLPKRAGTEPLNKVTVGTDFNGGYIANDYSHRFGEEQQLGVRVNTAFHGGNTVVDNEKSQLGLVAVGLDYKTDRLRLSGDLGYVNNRLKETRPNVTLGSAITEIPNAINGQDNFSQKWTYSNEEDVFGSYRAEYDINDSISVNAAYGFRHGEEHNSLANMTVNDAQTGTGTFYRFDNARVDMVNTGELSVKAKLYTGDIEHNLILSGSAFRQDTRNAYVMDYTNTFENSIYHPLAYSEPAYSDKALYGNALSSPKLTTRTQLASLAIGDNLKAFDEKLTFMFGGRFQNIQQETYAYGTQTKSSDYSESKFTPALGISYKFLPELSVYANYIESLAKGLSNTNKESKETTTLKPFVAKQKEVGVKYENDQFGAGIDYFDIEKQRAILQNNVFSNAGKYVHRGIELTAYGQMTDDVKVLGGMMWLDAKQKNTGDEKYNDKYEVGVPKFQANIGLDWKLPVNSDISLSAQYTYTGATYASLDNNLKVNDWSTLDLGANYKTIIGDIPTTFNFKINNITGEKYWASVGLFDNINSTGNTNNGYLVAGLPRTYMLSASFDF